MTPGDALNVLETVGIAGVATRTVVDEDEAVRAAETMSFPVVLKGFGPSLVHKSDVGAVRLGLGSEARTARGLS